MNARRKERRAKRQAHADISKLVQMVTGRLAAGDTAIRFYDAPPAAPGAKTVEIAAGDAVADITGPVARAPEFEAIAVRMIERARLRLGCKASELRVISAARLSRAKDPAPLPIDTLFPHGRWGEISPDQFGTPDQTADDRLPHVPYLFFASGHRDVNPNHVEIDSPEFYESESPHRHGGVVGAPPEPPRPFSEGGTIKRALICACGCRGPFTTDYCPDCDRPIE